MSSASTYLSLIAGGFLCFGVYHLLKLWFKFGAPYTSLRKEMEEIREQLQTKQGECTSEEFSQVVKKFDQNARDLRIPKFQKQNHL